MAQNPTIEAVVVSKPNNYFIEWRKALENSLGRHFRIARYSHDGLIDISSPSLYCVLGDVECMKVPDQIARQVAEGKTRRATFLLWYTERIPIRGHSCPEADARFARFRDTHDVYDSIHCFDLGMEHFLADEGIEAHHAPVGFDTVFDYGLSPLEPRSDLYFTGEVNERRRGILSALSDHGLDVSEAFGHWGMQRAYNLASTKAYLNLHYDDYPMNESLRLVHGIANRTLCVSETIAYPEPLVPGEHFIMGTPEELPELAATILADEKACEEMATAAREFLVRELTMDRVVAGMLETL